MSWSFRVQTHVVKKMRNKKILRSEDVGSYPDSPMFNFDSLFTVAVELPFRVFVFRFRKQRFRRVWIFSRRWSSSPVAVMRSPLVISLIFLLVWPLSKQACQRICQWHPSFGTLASETCPWWSCEQLHLSFAASTIQKNQTGVLPAPSCCNCLTSTAIFI